MESSNSADGALRPVKLRSLSTRGVLVPLNFTLGTSAAIVRKVPLLLVDLTTDDGTVGHAYAFCYRPSGARAVAAHLAEAFDLLAGMPVTPYGSARTLSRQFALLGVTGAVRMALSLFDMALWDALARSRGLPLATLLGSGPRELQAYDSRGLGLMDPDRLSKEAEALLAKGLKAVKLRLGYPSATEDMAALKAVRRVVGDAIAIMVDYNQALTAAEAIARGRQLEEEGIYWLEEPVLHEDCEAYARVTSALRVAIQIGENFNGPEGMLHALRRGASDYVMPDVARIGGVTGWMQAAALAAASGIEMSSHLMPEVSAQLLCATPTAHWLEYVDWADALLQEPLRVVDGKVSASQRPGSGIEWDEDKIRKLEAI
ncbi:enolase C-terminal domain-like protein [Variovorax saccharolyticus]|uniref:enolase C-terminal domain-like protein n=1 Tax=Variovorax saccharolyticus TaxID=3053516 RepID=UPI0025785038|nr:enolase C-terminal domain-like protein [Variovorax sp. J22R187]MDM0022273.1 enolase C-terminal domain-like protein [Variovorax sp. J22R187]